MPELPVGWATCLYPPGGGGAVGPVHGEPMLSAPLPDGARPTLTINMVATLDGRVVSERGTARGLGSRTDLDLLQRLRAEADAVLHGAGTLRAERFVPRVPEGLARRRAEWGLPRQPMAVLVTTSGVVPDDHPWLRTTPSAPPRLVYASRESARRLEREGVEVHLSPGASLDLRDVLRDLWNRGARRVVCEGGPSLNAGLFQADCVDELFLTLVPDVQGGMDPRRLVAESALAPRRLALRSVYEREGELFLRYARATA